MFGPFGPDKGQGGKYLFLPPDHHGEVPDGYFVVESPTFSVLYGLRGFKVDGKTDEAVALMKQLKVYPLADAGDPPAMEYLNGSGQAIDTVHTDTIAFFEQLAVLVDEEPAELFTPLERAHMQSIGIEKGKPFAPDQKRRALLSEGARAAAAIARANSFASRDPETYYWPDRRWQCVVDVPYTFERDGILMLDRRAFVYYMALGNDPAMMAKNVGAGSQYVGVPRRQRRLPGRRRELPAPCSARGAGQQLLIGRRLRRDQPLRATEQPAAAVRQPIHRSARQRRPLGRHLPVT